MSNQVDEIRLLGVDLASTKWMNVGSALISLSPDLVPIAVDINPISWPTGETVTANALADTVDAFARERRVCIVSLDGPQAWRDPTAPISQGMGRACEKSAKTPGKTGTPGITWPATYSGYIGFSIEVFDTLLRQPDVRLVNDPKVRRLEPPKSGYHALECFPTATWKSSGLLPLPAKGKHPNVAEFSTLLRLRWGLPEAASTSDHDALQAIVAALPAVALAGAAEPIAHGRPAAVLPNQKGRVEGIIWDARPLDTASLAK